MLACHPQSTNAKWGFDCSVVQLAYTPYSILVCAVYTGACTLFGFGVLLLVGFVHWVGCVATTDSGADADVTGWWPGGHVVRVLSISHYHVDAVAEFHLQLVSRSRVADVAPVMCLV